MNVLSVNILQYITIQLWKVRVLGYYVATLSLRLYIPNKDQQTVLNYTIRSLLNDTAA